MPLWKPTDRSDVHLWLKPEDITGSNTWMDSSGKGNSPSHTAPPSKSATLKNGRNSAAFNGSSQYVKLDDGGTQPTDVGTGNFYIGAFIKVPTISSSVQTILAKDRTGSTFSLRMNASRYVITALPSGNVTGGDALTIGNYYWVWCFREGTGSNEVSVGYGDTVDTTGTSTSNLDEDSEFYVGVRENSGGSGLEKYWSGEISEVLVVHAYPGTDDVDRIEGYVSHKFGEEGQLDSAHAYKSGPPTACHCVAEKTLSTTALSSNPRNPAELSENLNIFDERR